MTARAIVAKRNKLAKMFNNRRHVSRNDSMQEEKTGGFLSPQKDHTMEIQSFRNCVSLTFWKYCLHFAQICHGNPACVTWDACVWFFKWRWCFFFLLFGILCHRKTFSRFLMKVSLETDLRDSLWGIKSITIPLSYQEAAQENDIINRHAFTGCESPESRI